MREYQAASTAIPYSLDPAASSPGLKDRVLAAATGQKAVRPAMLSRVFWSAAALFLLALLFGSLFQEPAYTDMMEMAGTKQAAPAALGTLQWVGRRVKLEVSSLPALPPGKVYQLWQIDKENVIEARTFTLDPKGELAGEDRMKLLVARGQTFALTVEPAGGSRSPTMPIYCAGKVP